MAQEDQDEADLEEVPLLAEGADEVEAEQLMGVSHLETAKRVRLRLDRNRPKGSRASRKPLPKDRKKPSRASTRLLNRPLRSPLLSTRRFVNSDDARRACGLGTTFGLCI